MANQRHGDGTGIMRSKLLAISTALVLGLVACGGQSDGNGAEETDDASEEMTAPDPFELRLATFFEDPGVFSSLESVVEEFEADYPYVTVEIENSGFAEYWPRILTQAGSGDLPDVMYGVPGYHTPLLESDQFLDISELAAADEDLDIDDFAPGMIEHLQFGDALVGLPYDLNALVFLYNVDIFDQVGLDYPTPDWTFDDAKEAAERIHEQFPDVHPLGCLPSGLYTDAGIFKAFGAGYVEDGSVALNSEQGRQALEWFVANVENGLTQSSGAFNREWQHDFAADGVAMMCGSGTQFPTFEESGVNFDFVRVPAGPAARSSTVNGGTVHVHKGTEHPEEAYELLTRLTSTDGLKRIIADNQWGLPARVSSRDGMPENLVKYGEVLQEAEAAEFPLGIREFWELTGSVYELVWLGQLSPEAALTQIEEEGNALLGSSS